MMNRNKYLFKKEKKEDLLQGRSITFVAKNRVGISQQYLTNILNGKLHCSYIIAKKIANSYSVNTKLEDYFEVIE